MINRNTTEGKYGSWGHDLSDLDLVEVFVEKRSNGKTYLRLGVDS